MVYFYKFNTIWCFMKSEKILRWSPGKFNDRIHCCFTYWVPYLFDWNKPIFINPLWSSAC